MSEGEGLQSPFHEFVGLEVVAGCRHDGTEAGAQFVAKILLSLASQLGFGDEYSLIEHPVEDVLYVAREVDAAAARVHDLEVVEQPKVLIIPGKTPGVPLRL